MAVKHMKEVKIHILYIERCQVLKIFPTFVAYNTRYGAKDGS